MKTINWEQVFFCTPQISISSEGNRVCQRQVVIYSAEGHWLHVIVVNVHAPSEEKSEKLKDIFYEELEMFDYFPKYYMKILLGDFNAKLGREDIFKPIIGQESLHQDSNDNGVRLVNFATSKNLVVKSTMFPHRNIHKYTWTSPDGKTHNQIDHLLTGDGTLVCWMCEVLGERIVVQIIIWSLPRLGKDWQWANRLHRGQIGKDLT